MYSNGRLLSYCSKTDKNTVPACHLLMKNVMYQFHFTNLFLENKPKCRMERISKTYPSKCSKANWVLLSPKLDPNTSFFNPWFDKSRENWTWKVSSKDLDLLHSDDCASLKLYFIHHPHFPESLCRTGTTRTVLLLQTKKDDAEVMSSESWSLDKQPAPGGKGELKQIMRYFRKKYCLGFQWNFWF